MDTYTKHSSSAPTDTSFWFADKQVLMRLTSQLPWPPTDLFFSLSAYSRDRFSTHLSHLETMSMLKQFLTFSKVAVDNIWAVWKYSMLFQHRILPRVSPMASSTALNWYRIQSTFYTVFCLVLFPYCKGYLFNLLESHPCHNYKWPDSVLHTFSLCRLSLGLSSLETSHPGVSFFF